MLYDNAVAIEKPTKQSTGSTWLGGVPTIVSSVGLTQLTPGQTGQSMARSVNVDRVRSKSQRSSSHVLDLSLIGSHHLNYLSL